MILKPGMSIKRISVRKLFGIYDYDLPPKNHGLESDKIFILYGDNGSGKTTILKLVFHILSDEKRAGHKTFVAKTKFQEFKIEFSNGVIVRAFRENDSLVASFQMEIIHNNNIIELYQFIVDEKNIVYKKNIKETKVGYISIVNNMNHFLGNFFFLADDRTINISIKSGLTGSPLFIDRDKIGIDQKKPHEKLLQISMRNVLHYIREQTMEGANIGESNVNSLYKEIIARLIQSPIGENSDKKNDKNKILERIKNLEEETKKYSKYGMISPFKSKEIIAALKIAPDTHIAIIDKVIVPYLESMEAKLSALKITQQTIEIFIETLNDFMQSKTIEFDISKGIQIFSRQKELIPPEKLSSGERNLLLLFCNTITSLDRQSIFIIDEPEISLNIKWQRKLLDSLVECVRDNPVQYIFATHSFEILSQHLDNVAKLEDIEV